MKTKHILIVVCLFLLFLLLRTCQQSNKYKNQIGNIQDVQNDTIEYYNNKLGQEVAQKLSYKGDKQQLELMIANSNDTIGQLRETVRGFKKVIAAAKLDQELRIDSVFVPFETPITLDQFFSKPFNKKTEFYSLYGNVQNKGVSIDSLKIPNTLTMVLGNKKTGFFSTEYRIDATNSNQLIKTTGLDSYMFSEPVKRFGVGFTVGYGLSSNFAHGPFIGVGLNYNLIRF